MHPRRVLPALIVLLVLISTSYAQTPTSLTPSSTERQPSDSPPPSAMLQTGDLLWPKVPGAWVPYGSQPGTEREAAAREWVRERDAYLAELRAKKSPTADEKARYRELMSMDYRTFKQIYLGDLDAGQIENFGGSVFYVGHVGIVDIADGIPWVCEAVMGKGVRRITYSNWLAERRGELVWLGRISGATEEQQAAIGSFARQQVGKPYRFFNFDLSDASGFYCSKLAWLSIKTATAIAPDDNPDPHRVLWYSPKRLMKSPHVVLLHQPGNYATR